MTPPDVRNETMGTYHPAASFDPREKFKHAGDAKKQAEHQKALEAEAEAKDKAEKGKHEADPDITLFD